MRVRAIYLAVCMAGLGGLLVAGSAGVTYTITTVAGTDYAGDGGPATAAQLGQAQGLVADSSGNIYVADAADHRVRKITPAGLIMTVAGTGRSGFSGDGGPAAAALLNRPYGLALDSAGNLYIADLGNLRVRRVSPDGVIRTIAGGGWNVPTPEGGDATGARLFGPRNVTVDSEGNLYTSDFLYNCVYKVTPSGVISTIVARDLPGPASGGASDRLSSPAGLAVDATGALYIADSGSKKIRKVYRGVVTTEPILGGFLTTPIGLALDWAGDLYIADSGDRDKGTMILKRTSGGQVRTVAGTGRIDYSGDGGPATSAALTSASDVTLDAAGNLYIADGRRVRKVTRAGVISTIAGDGTFRPAGDGGVATLFAHLWAPQGVALDGTGNLYITDTGNHRVRKVAGSGLITTVAGTGKGDSDAGDGGLATAAQLAAPAGLVSDVSGNLWIADGRRIRKVSAGGIISAFAGTVAWGYSGDGGPALLARLGSPRGVALDGAGNLYIADTDNHCVRRVARDGLISTLAGKGVPGYAGDGGAAVSALLYNPTGVHVDSAGNLYVADTGNHVIRRVTPGGGGDWGVAVIETVAGTGVLGFGGDGGVATSAGLYEPYRIAMDRTGNLYIADSMNHRIRKVTPDGVISTIAGNGTRGYDGDGGLALAAQLNDPTDVAVDGAGNVYIADFGNDRIRKLTPVSVVIPPAPVEALNLVSAASLVASPVAPGQIATIYGSGLGPPISAGPKLKASGLLDTLVADTQVLFNGKAAPLLYVQDYQINLQVPYSVAGLGAVEVEVRYGGVVKVRGTVPVVDAAPAFFTTGGGTGQAAALNEDGSLNSLFNPAPPGSLVTLYATGEGQTDPPGTDGKLSAAPFPRPLLPLLLRIGGLRAEIQFAGSAPGLVGLLQINARVPDHIPSGNQALELTVGIAKSWPGVTIAIQ